MSREPAAAAPRDDDTLARVVGRVGVLTLNKPNSINALSRAMIRRITETVTAWQDERAVEVVLIRSSNKRGFCAGGDIRVVRESEAPQV